MLLGGEGPISQNHLYTGDTDPDVLSRTEVANAVFFFFRKHVLRLVIELFGTLAAANNKN